ncbi:MAG TPA: ABC transporter substrate-binding protein [Candidatus Syntrophosphaera sp.]|nr:ABC transporter substrate-binding protein [Candidatus Syntrophosphaera sp.]
MAQHQSSVGQPASRELFKLRYRLKWLPQAQFAGGYMAASKGFYRAAGLDVEILPGGVDDPPYESLLKGDSDISSLNLIFAIRHYHLGPRLVNLAQITQKNSTYLVGKKSSGIRQISDLRGRKVGVWRDEAGEYVRFMLENLDPTIQVVPIDWSVNLLLKDAIDMMNVMDYNEYHRLLMAGLDEDELVSFNLSDYGYDLIDDGLYTTETFYQAHTRECWAFAEATLAGWRYAFAHTEETLDVILERIKAANLPANRTHQAWMLGKMKDKVLANPERIGYLDPKDFKHAQEILRTENKLPSPVSYSSFYPHENRIP